MSDVDKTLEERGRTYGEFAKHAAISQRLKSAMHTAPNWGLLRPDMQEALDMIQHKIARILNGDPAFVDNWHDITGYARLVEQTLEPQLFEAPPATVYGVPVGPTASAHLRANASKTVEHQRAHHTMSGAAAHSVGVVA